MEHLSRQSIWEAVVSEAIPELVQGSYSTLEECRLLHIELAKGGGEWGRRKGLEAMMDISSGLRIVRKHAIPGETRFLGKTLRGRNVFYPQKMHIYTVYDGDKEIPFALVTPLYDVDMIWKYDLCAKMDYIWSTKDAYSEDDFTNTFLPTAVAYFRLLSLIIHPMDDANGRLVNAWSALQFRKIGLQLNLPLVGQRYNLDEESDIARLEAWAIPQFMQVYGIPFWHEDLKGFYDLRVRLGEVAIDWDARKQDISTVEYQEILARALKSEIQRGSELCSPLLANFCYQAGQSMLCNCTRM